ncbi:hypothetical protein OSB04_018968 [Centaurea solstitialis]|uniref:DUF7731 domain-containing protein n=1 Tax=Centaurea solstitialis TaxID=347529 RepID=A0AA38WBX7_9ASTR|nr:hypothetical protein OSB04_018968 [Centaurea solstitialis]
MNSVTPNLVSLFEQLDAKFGRAQPGIAGTGNGYIPQPGGGISGGGFGGGGFGNGGGGSGNNGFGGFGGIGGGVIAKALICLGDKASDFPTLNHCIAQSLMRDVRQTLMPSYPQELIMTSIHVTVFYQQQIYNGCGESYRLTESGDLHVPPDYTDQYCGGPCLTETKLVLSCINDVLSNFIFYNRATVRDVKDTITAGCSYGPTRGDFNVAEHIQSYGSNSYKLSYPNLFGIVPLISMCILLF